MNYLKTTVKFALEREDLGRDFKKFLKEVTKEESGIIGETKGRGGQLIKLLVIGGAGYIGSHTAKFLLEEKHQEEKPVGVIHFAALCRVSESVAKPAEYLENNVLGGLNLLLKKDKARRGEYA